MHVLVLANKGLVFKCNRISQSKHRKCAITHTYAITHFTLSLHLKWKDVVLAMPKLQIWVPGNKQANVYVGRNISFAFLEEKASVN